MLMSCLTYSQLSITSNLDDGVIEISYGASGDWSLYDPFFDPVVVYLWVLDTDNSTGSTFQDSWNGTLAILSWNGSAHVGSIDFRSHNFENLGGIMPIGTTMTNFNLILRNPAGDRQSGNLTATDYGFSTAVLPVEEHILDNTNIFSYQNNLFIENLSTQSYNMAIFDSMGKVVKQVNGNDNQVDISSLQSGLYFVTLKSAEGGFFKKKFLKQE